jgi:small subunit ribosomal protein S17
MKGRTMETRTNRRKFLSGEVVSDKMNKTRVVQVRWTNKHAKYTKTMRHAVKYKAHDEKNASKLGDIVKIMETRPISKDKRWVIMEILKTS